MKSLYRGKYSLVITVLWVLIVISLVFLVRQRWQGFRLKGDIARGREEISLLQQKIDARQSLASRSSELSDDLGGEVRTLTWSERMPMMVDRVTRLIEEQGASVNTLRPEPAAAVSGVARFPLRLTTECDLAQLTKVMLAVEKAEPLLAMDRLYVRVPLEEAGASGGLTVEMTVTSFALQVKAASEDKASAKGGRKPPAVSVDAGREEAR